MNADEHEYQVGETETKGHRKYSRHMISTFLAALPPEARAAVCYEVLGRDRRCQIAQLAATALLAVPLWLLSHVEESRWWWGGIVGGLWGLCSYMIFMKMVVPIALPGYMGKIGGRFEECPACGCELREAESAICPDCGCPIDINAAP